MALDPIIATTPIFKEIFFGFRLTKGLPIDERFQIDSLASIDTKIPLAVRTEGLIFFSKLENTFYCFTNDLTAPVLLTEKIFASMALSLALAQESDYADILAALTALNPKIGNICLVKPLGVSFQFDGTNWNYFSGEYNFGDQTGCDALPAEFKKTGSVVVVAGTPYIFDSQKALSAQIIVIESFDDIATATEENRYYLINGFLHYRFGGMLFQIGQKTKLFKNLTLTPGIEIEHNFNTTYVRGLLQVYSSNPLINNQLINVELKAINANNVQVKNSISVTGDLILKAFN